MLNRQGWQIVKKSGFYLDNFTLLQWDGYFKYFSLKINRIANFAGSLKIYHAVSSTCIDNKILQIFSTNYQEYHSKSNFLSLRYKANQCSNNMHNKKLNNVRMPINLTMYACRFCHIFGPMQTMEAVVRNIVQRLTSTDGDISNILSHNVELTQ